LWVEELVAVAGTDYTGFAGTVAEEINARLGDSLEPVHP